MTADLTLDLCRAAREAGSGLFPCELRVLKNFSAISFSVCVSMCAMVMVEWIMSLFVYRM